MLRIISLLLLLYSSVSIGQPSVTYEPESSKVQIEHNICQYGRGINEQLKSNMLQQTLSYLSNNYESFAKQLKLNHRLTPKQIQYIHQALLSSLSQDSFEHKVGFQGNDTCLASTAVVIVSKDLDFESLFTFNEPAKYYFVTPQGLQYQAVKEKLRQGNINYLPNKIMPFLKEITRFSKQDETFHYFAFDLANYKKALNNSRSKVFIKGDDVYRRILAEYLEANTFQIMADQESAYWSLSISGSLEQNKYINIRLELSGENEDNVILTNNSRALPAAPLSNEAFFTKFVKLHLELLKLPERLK